MVSVHAMARAGLVAAAIWVAPVVLLGAQGAPPAAAGDTVTARLMARLSALAADSMEGRRAGTVAAARARRWLHRELAAIGAEPVEQSFRLAARGRGAEAAPSPDTVGVNLLLRVPGRRADGPVLVVTAHYDHVGLRNGEVFNGADDNASGTVALLEIAGRLLREPPEHDVWLAWLDGEEMGLQGARAFIAAPPVPLARIAMNINLDMVGRQDGGALWVAGTSHTPALRPLADAAVREAAARPGAVAIRFGHDTKDGKPGDDWTSQSDHGAFHALGIPFLYLGVEDHPDYHRPGDDAEKIDPAFFRGTVEFAWALVRAADRGLGTLPPRR
jgi:Zn-dependent M28 family amino/carboxypeptidase